MTMFADVLTSLAPWEIVALAAICAWTALGIAITISTALAFALTRPPSAAQQSAPVRVVQPQPAMPSAIPSFPAVPGVAS
jgi:hypothetical protein